MSKFITPQDYDASIHREILDALTRNDNAIIEICEDRAISEMRGYLSTRYDADAIFKTEGAARNDGGRYRCISLVQYPQPSKNVADTQGSLRSCNGMAETGGNI